MSTKMSCELKSHWSVLYYSNVGIAASANSICDFNLERLITTVFVIYCLDNGCVH